jgi:hypothetical protein
MADIYKTGGEAEQILKLLLAPGILTLVIGIIVKLKPTIKLKIGEYSIELSGYQSKKDREAMIQTFISSVEKFEKGKNVFGSLKID